MGSCLNAAHQNTSQCINSTEQNCMNDATQELMSDGFSMEEATKAIQLSLQPNDAFELKYDNVNVNVNVNAMSICTSDDIKLCPHSYQLIKVMHSYTQHLAIDDIKALDVLNDFQHLIIKHNNDKQFEHIVNELGDCNIMHCDIFKRHSGKNKKRHYSDKTLTDLLLNGQHYVLCGFLDKIHCYYQHCYDVGHKLSINDKNMIKNDIADHELCDGLLINKEYQKMIEVLTSRRQNCGSACDELNCRMNQKYNQLLLIKNDKMDSKTNEYEFATKQQPKMHTYSFGYSFIYGNTDDEQRDVFYHFYQDEFIFVSPKYSSLKKELISNPIAIITVEQFKKEYEKALIHFNSYYCKSAFTPRPKRDGYGRCRSNDETWSFRIEYVIAVMIYCNYDFLSYEFSKTYRINNGKKHNNFYFLGMYLKEMVYRFGNIADNFYGGRNRYLYANYSDVDAFYHGITEQLLFPEYISDGGILIRCPLSTSSVFEVATNFTNHNAGFVVTFKPVNGSNCKYFAVSWLSDFPNEFEYLFIQNNIKGKELRMANIFDLKNGFEYELVFAALGNIEDIFDQHPITETQYIHKIDNDKLTEVTAAIVSNQLSQKMQQYEMCGLTQYAQKMCDIYFGSKRQIDIQYPFFRNNQLFKQDSLAWFINLEFDFINIEIITMLFPNIEKIEVSNVKMCSNMVEYILMILMVLKDKNLNLELITITPYKDSELSIQQAIDMFKKDFTEIGVVMEARNGLKHTELWFFLTYSKPFTWREKNILLNI